LKKKRKIRKTIMQLTSLGNYYLKPKFDDYNPFKLSSMEILIYPDIELDGNGNVKTFTPEIKRIDHNKRQQTIYPHPPIVY
jgi:hypothetical protein